MARVLVIGSRSQSLILFRGSLLKSMVEAGHEVTAAAPDADDSVRQGLADMHVAYADVRLSRTGLNPFADLSTVLSMLCLIRRVRPDAILTYTMKPVLYGSLAARWCRVPAVFAMITGLGYAFSGGGIKQRIVGVAVRGLCRISLSHCSAVFFQNPDDRSEFEREGLLHARSARVLINGSGVDLDWYRPSPYPEQLSFLLMARLISSKGICEYVEAARRVKACHPSVTFRLAGRLDEAPEALTQGELEAWVREGVVEFLGLLRDVRPALHGASVYVLPSYREGTPRSVLEAMAAARPVVTTDVPGCRETVQDGVNGFLVPPRDVDALVVAMERFIHDPGLVPGMGARGRELAVEKYDVHKVNAAILDAMGLKR